MEPLLQRRKLRHGEAVSEWTSDLTQAARPGAQLLTLLVRLLWLLRLTF